MERSPGERTPQSIVVAAALAAVLLRLPGAASGAILFEDVTPAAMGFSTQLLPFGHGVALHDIDADGDLDVYMLDGPGAANRLLSPSLS